MKTTVKVAGMSCQHCIKTLEKELSNAGFTSFKVELGKVDVNENLNSTQLANLKKIIVDAGYKVINE